MVWLAEDKELPIGEAVWMQLNLGLMVHLKLINPWRSIQPSSLDKDSPKKR
jgi:hypothetical protein